MTWKKLTNLIKSCFALTKLSFSCNTHTHTHTQCVFKGLSCKLGIFFVLLSCGLLVGANFVSTVQAVAGITVDEMPLGTVVTLNGIAFIKISATNKFMAVEAFDNCNPETDMQCFDGCDDWVTPTYGTMNYSNSNGLNSGVATYLTDLRDGKQYDLLMASVGWSII